MLLNKKILKFVFYNYIIKKYDKNYVFKVWLLFDTFYMWININMDCSFYLCDDGIRVHCQQPYNWTWCSGELMLSLYHNNDHVSAYRAALWDSPWPRSLFTHEWRGRCSYVVIRICTRCDLKSDNVDIFAWWPNISKFCTVTVIGSQKTIYSQETLKSICIGTCWLIKKNILEKIL